MSPSVGPNVSLSREELAVFVAEAEEQLQALEDGAMSLEGRDRLPADLVDSMFRAAHTLKGSSAAAGFESMARLTHRMESVLDALRKGGLAGTTAVADVLLECVDALRLLKGEVETGKPTGFKTDYLEERLATLLEAGTARLKQAFGDERVAAAASSVSDHEWPAAVFVAFCVERTLPQVRCYQALRLLASYGRVLLAQPDLDTLEALAGEHEPQCPSDRDGTLVCLVACRREVGQEELRQALAAELDDVERLAVERLAVERLDPGHHAERAVREDKAVGEDKQGAQFGAISTTVRVDTARLDGIANLVAELVIDRTNLVSLHADLVRAQGQTDIAERLGRLALHMGRVSSDLQEQVMRMRMFPIEHLFRKFPRMVRDLANRQGKMVRFEVSGQSTELDRSVIEELGDPLIHLLRNAVGHGIETPDRRIAGGKPVEGLVQLRALHEGSYITIVVEDDGKGIDALAVKRAAVARGIVTQEQADGMGEREAIGLIFAPGLSTSDRVGEISGRGVGMDIVRRNLERINGSIEVESWAGKGTRFTMRLPLTLAIVRALLVEIAGQCCALPLSMVAETFRAGPGSVRHVSGGWVALLRGRLMPLISLASVFNHEAEPGPDGVPQGYGVVVSGGGESGQVALLVDGLAGEQEVVVKGMGPLLSATPGVSGVTILGDGAVAPIVDVPSLVRYCAELTRRAQQRQQGQQREREAS